MWKANIPLRGHRDDSSHMEDDSVNCGNFQALLDYRVSAGDIILKEHFENANRNATYRSKTIQNELIDACGEFITKEIFDKIKEAQYFAIMTDEGTYISNKTQLPLVLRYYSTKGRENSKRRFCRFC